MGEEQFNIQLFGKFGLWYYGHRVKTVGKARLQEFLAYLFLYRNSPQSRQYLAFQLWPDSSEKQARTNLRNLLFKTHKLLPDSDRYLIADNSTIRWNTELPCWLDVAQFEQAIRAV